MSILEKIGLNRKKVSSPIFADRRHQDDKWDLLRSSIIFKVVIMLSFLGLLLTLIPQYTFKKTYNYQIGEPWRQDDLTAPFTYSLQKSQEQIEQEKREIRQNTPPIFHVNHNANINIQTSLDSLFNNIKPVLEAYYTWQSDTLSAATNDSLVFIQTKNRSGVGISDDAWQPFLRNYYLFKNDSLQSVGEQSEPYRFVGKDIYNKINETINELLNDGIINIPKSEITTDQISVRNLRKQTEKTYSLSNVRDLKEAREFAQFRLSRTFNSALTTTAFQLFNLVVEPNFIYKKEVTQNRIQTAIADISTTKGAVAQGQVIIRKGDIVTDNKYNMLKSLAVAQSQRASIYEKWIKYTGDAIILLSVLIFFFMYLYLYRRHIFDNNFNLLLVILAMSLVVSLTAVITGWDSVSLYAAPIALTPIVLTIIFDSRVGLMAAVTLSLICGLNQGNGYEFVIATFTASGLGVFSVRDIKNRSQFLIATPLIILFGYSLVLTGFTLTKTNSWAPLLQNLKFSGVNALLMLFTYPVILLFEKLFKVTTDFTLLELSDTNAPLLKDLMSKAPGSFHHSLQVSNLAESAASAIGANALLCRVGALYHDIGKMNRPDYFIENQSGGNTHDNLKPQMSARVIKEHVTKGIELAEEANLPDVLIDFIKTHHGTTLISFFYKQAKESANEQDKEHEIQEEDFRYDGPIPNSRETGILLLADCIEASSRAMKKPNYNKLKNLIENMVDSRIQEGQLNDTPLTFRDIAIIKEAFLQNLVGIHHGRVEYPDKEQDNEVKAVNS